MPSDLEIRLAALNQLHEFRAGRGLEIGPLYTPLLTRSEFDVEYLDVVSTDDLTEYYRDDPGVPEDDIVDVDHVLKDPTGRIRSIAETVGNVRFDWAVASHVVEHVPDVIGWLADLAAVVRPGGALLLVVPDKRFTFDLHRPTTTVGAMVEAHANRETIPSLRTVHDHFYGAVTVDTAALWDERHPPHPALVYDREEAARYVARHGSEHVDTHVWIFTPDLFLSQMHELRRLGLSDWYVDGFEPTAHHRLEFYVRLRRVDPETPPSTDLPDEIVPEDDRPHWLVEQADARARIETLQREVESLEAGLRQQRRRVGRLRRRLRAVERSRRWRLVNALLRPLSAVRRGSRHG